MKSAVTTSSRRTGVESLKSHAPVAPYAFDATVSGAILRGDDDAPLDLMDPASMKHVVSLGIAHARRLNAARSRVSAAAASGGAGFHVDRSGRMVIPADEDDRKPSADDCDDDFDSEDEAVGRPKGFRGVRNESNEGGRQAPPRGILRSSSGAGGSDKGAVGVSFGPSSSQGVSGWGQKRKKNNSSSRLGELAHGVQTQRFSGAQYKASKASGDLKKQEAKFEPFAYVPLDGRAMSGKHGEKAVIRFSSITASTDKHGRKRGEKSGGRGNASNEKSLGKRKRS